MAAIGRGGSKRGVGRCLVVAAGLAACGLPARAQAPGGAPDRLSPRGVEAFAAFEQAEGHKAFALGPGDYWGAQAQRPSGFQALRGAIWRCNRAAQAPCRGYRVDDVVTTPLYAAFEAASDAALATVRRAALRSPPFAEEDRDFGVPPTAALRTASYHAETPTTLAGAKTISTVDLVALLTGAGRSALIDVLDDGEDHRTLPTAWWWRAAGNFAGDQDAALTALLRALLASAVPDRATPLVFFCLSSRCWLSYNAALRAVAAGYTNVLWYRGGIDAWKAADLPLVKAVLTAQLY